VRDEKPEPEQVEEYEFDGPGEPGPDDPEVPEADALEQREAVTPQAASPRPNLAREATEANEADVLEQSAPVDDDEDAWE